MTVPETPDPMSLVASFLRDLSALALKHANTIAHAGPADLSTLSLGALQRSVAEALRDQALAEGSKGMKPRKLTAKLARQDEPNIRTALDRLAELGVAEKIDSSGPQEWRLTAAFRPSKA